MHLLLAAVLLPIGLAVILGRGEPAKTISCLGLMGVVCAIAVATLLGAARRRIGMGPSTGGA